MLVHSFIVLNYVNLILREKNTFYGELAYILEDFGRSLINFRYLWSKTKYFQGAENLFSGI